jgi:hypothetical protein
MQPGGRGSQIGDPKNLQGTDALRSIHHDIKCPTLRASASIRSPIKLTIWLAHSDTAQNSEAERSDADLATNGG